MSRVKATKHRVYGRILATACGLYDYAPTKYYALRAYLGVRAACRHMRNRTGEYENA